MRRENINLAWVERGKEYITCYLNYVSRDKGLITRLTYWEILQLIIGGKKSNYHAHKSVGFSSRYKHRTNSNTLKKSDSPVKMSGSAINGLYRMQNYGTASAKAGRGHFGVHHTRVWWKQRVTVHPLDCTACHRSGSQSAKLPACFYACTMTGDIESQRPRRTTTSRRLAD